MYLTTEQREVVASNEGLVHHVLRSFPPQWRDDLYGAACLGLVRAAVRYDPNRARFSTYACVAIRNGALSELKRLKQVTVSLPDLPSDVNVPLRAHQLELAGRARAALEDDEDRELFESYLAHGAKATARAFDTSRRNVHRRVARVAERVRARCTTKRIGTCGGTTKTATGFSYPTVSAPETTSRTGRCRLCLNARAVRVALNGTPCEVFPDDRVQDLCWEHYWSLTGGSVLVRYQVEPLDPDEYCRL